MFTTQPKQKGDFILEYAGELLDRKEGIRREQRYTTEHGSYSFYFGHRGNEFWYIYLYLQSFLEIDAH